MTEKGWAVVFDTVSFNAARNKIGPHWWLHSTLANAHRYAADLVSDHDTHPARVFWVVRNT